MFGLADLGHAVKTAAKLDDSATFSQCAECVGMHPEGDQIASAQRDDWRKIYHRGGVAGVAGQIHSGRIGHWIGHSMRVAKEPTG